MSQALQDAIAPVSFKLFAADFPAFAQQLGDSFARWGFAVICDHGLEDVRVRAARAETRAFFALPEAAKLKYKLPVDSSYRILQ